MSELIIDKLTTRDGSNVGAIVVADIDELLLLNTNKEINTTAIVKDNNRGGVFIYDATQSGVNNGGTIFDGWVRQYEGAVNVKWFGVSSSSTNVENQLYLQKTLEFCHYNFKSMCNDDTNLVIGLDSTVYIPQRASIDRLHTYDFGGMVINAADGITVFESGKPDVYPNGTWESTLGDYSHSSSNVIIENIVINGGDYGIRLSAMYQGCEIRDIVMHDTVMALDLDRCFYTKVSRVMTYADIQTSNSRIRFRGTCNLMTIEKCVVGNSQIGYLFENPSDTNRLEAITFRDNSVEGCIVGIAINSIPKGMRIEGNYFEGISENCIKLTQHSEGLSVSGNWFNLNNEANSYILSASTTAYLNNIVFEANNSYFQVLDGNFCREDVVSGITINVPTDVLYGANGLDDLLQYKEADYPKNSIISGYKYIGTDEGLARLNRGICAGNYSGRMTVGYKNANKLYGCLILAVGANNISYSTKIISQEHQLVFIHIRVSGNVVGYEDITGFIVGDTFQPFGGATPSGQVVTPSIDVDGYLQIDIAGFNSSPSSTFGAEVRII